MADVAFLAGSRLTATNLNAAFNRIRERYQQADQQVNNTTTPLSSNYLTLSLEANSGYIFESLLIYDTGTTPDIRFTIALPAGAGFRVATWRPPSSAASSTTTIDVITADTVTFAAGGAGVGTKMSTTPAGIVATAGTAGSLTIQFAQDIANASNTILAVHSWIRLTKVL